MYYIKIVAKQEYQSLKRCELHFKSFQVHWNKKTKQQLCRKFSNWNKKFFWFSIRLEKFRSNDHLIGEKKIAKNLGFSRRNFFSSTEFLLGTNFFVFPFSFDETLVVTKNIPKVHLLLIGRSFEFLIFCIFNFPHREAKIKLAYMNTFNDLALLKVDDNGLMSSMCAADKQK